MAKDLLSAMAVDRAKNPGRYSDGGGLYLQVSPSGTKSWLFRYKSNGREQFMGLGPYPDVTLAAARTKADACREQRAHGLDPKRVREEELERRRLETARSVTFRQCAEALLQSRKSNWRNEKHRQQWENTLATYVYPIIGALPVQSIDGPLVLKVLQQAVPAKVGHRAGLLWHARPETADRVRGRVEAVLDWAKFNQQRTGDNPARWRGNLDHVLKKSRDVGHHAALPFNDVADFMVKLKTHTAVAARAFEFLILTAARTGEVLRARWDEIDEAAGVWTIPVGRMKAGKEHRVPLSNAALEVLKDVKKLRRDGGWVFPNASGKKPLSNMVFLMLLRRMKRTDLTVHGFRSTFRDWTAECTSFAGEVAEMALAHTVADKVEAAYRRGDLFEKRRQLMDAWARYCSGETGGENVRNLPAVAAA